MLHQGESCAAVLWTLLSLLTLLLLLSPCSSPCPHTQEMGAQPKQNLTILSLLPYPAEEGDQQPSWDEGYTLFITEQMAVDRLNCNPDILPGYHLVLASSDSGCNIKSKTLCPAGHPSWGWWGLAVRDQPRP